MLPTSRDVATGDLVRANKLTRIAQIRPAEILRSELTAEAETAHYRLKLVAVRNDQVNGSSADFTFQRR